MTPRCTLVSSAGSVIQCLIVCICIVFFDGTQHHKTVVVGVSRYVLRQRRVRAVRRFRHVRRPRPVCCISVPTWTCCLCYRRVHKERPPSWSVSRPAWQLDFRRRPAPPRPRNSTTTRACIEHIVCINIHRSYTTLFKSFIDRPCNVYKTLLAQLYDCVVIMCRYIQITS